MTDVTGPLQDADGDDAERRSTRALAMAFVGRGPEMRSAIEHLLPAVASPEGRTLVVEGDSGTGKTYFVRELMRQLFERQPDGLYLYLDIANDDYQSSRAIASILKIPLVAGLMRNGSGISVPEATSLERYRRRTRKRGFGRGLLRAIVHAAGGIAGMGTAVRAALDRRPVDGADVEIELAAYLAWVAKRTPIFLAIDNTQFLNVDVRLTIESVVQGVGRNMRFIAVERTADAMSSLDPPIRCFSERRHDIRLGKLTRAETSQLVLGALGREDPETHRLADDIFTKTEGLAKDVEYCLRQYALELGRGARAGAVEGLLSTIDRLPVMHRQFLVIASLLDGGVDSQIARNVVRRLSAVYEAAHLDEVVGELVARDYLRINGDTGTRLRPGHERIVTAIRRLADDELQEDVRRSLVEELAAALEAPDGDENEAYLLHCLVGLQSAQELTRSLHYISRLVQTQHRQDQFSYLVALADELHEIVALLPEHVLGDLLDAMQKSSAFERGLQVLSLLDAKEVPGSTNRQIYRFKYLIQAYRYEEALALSETLREGEWSAVYRVNALLALDRLEDARLVTDAHLRPRITEAQAVLRRNTITLFDPETALRHLDDAYAYFDRDQSEFRLATVDTNRSVVHLNTDMYGDALRSLERAATRMRRIGSRELFQAQINLAVRNALLGGYGAALEWLDAAALQVPRALLLDQIKITQNRTVIRCAAGELEPHAAIEELQECVRRIRGVRMPYLHRALLDNIASLSGEHPHPEASGTVSLRVPIALHAGPAAGRTLLLLLSIHWRY